MRFLTFGILYVAIYLGAGVALAAHPSARTIVADVLLTLLPLAVCAAVWRRRAKWEGSQQLFWNAVAAGYLLWCVGEVGFAIQSVTEQRSWVQWHTLFSLCGGIGPVVALLTRPYLGPRKSVTWAIAIDLAGYAVLMGFVYAYFVMVPSVVPASPRLSTQSTLFALVQIQRLVLFAGLAASAWASRRTAWHRIFTVLAMGTGLGFFLRFLASGAITRGRYYEGSVYDLAWIVPFLAFFWAAREAPSSAGDSASVPTTTAGWRTAVVSTVPLLVIPAVGFGLLRVQPLGDPGDSVRLLLTTLSMVVGLGLLTLRLSAQSGELQRAEGRMRLLAAATEQTADLILITRGDGSVEHGNDACVHALGYGRTELGRLALPDLLERGFERMVDHIGREVRAKGIWRGTLIHRRKDGTTFPAAATVVALRDSAGRVTHFVGVERDITEELRLRDQLVHSERLSAVGELIAGVAHEINNPLQTIIGTVELMLDDAADAPHSGDLEVVRREATRAGQIVRNLLAFVRKSTAERVRADLNQIAAAAAALREQPLARKNVALQLELSPGVLPVMVNRDEIQQIVLNLIMNAEQAIGQQAGTIVVRTVAGEHTHAVQVIDDGPGISPELHGRVFEPFFTTKDVGQGTGLGLSLALGIATAHGGALELLTDVPPGAFPASGHGASGRPAAGGRRGAAFQLTLPARRPLEVEADVPLPAQTPG